MVYRIKALKNFGDVKKGDIGGYVQSEENLSQLGDCWIYDDAIVFENALIEGNAKIYDNTNVSGNAVISNCAKIFGNVKIKDNAKIHNSSIIKNYAIVMESAQIYDFAIIEDNAKVAGNSIIRDNCTIFRNAVIRDSYIFGKASIGEDAKIFNSNDYISISNVNNNSLTVFRAKNNKNNELNIVYNNCSFTFREFIKYVKIILCKKYRKELLLALKFAKYKLSIKD